MKQNALFLLIVSIVFFYSCKGLSEKKLVGNYYLVAMDNDNNQTSLSYKDEQTGNFIGVIDDMVYSTGFDSNFIIAKQHPDLSIATPNLNITHYFIIVLAGRGLYSDKKNVYGPYNETDFIQKRKELGVPNVLNFSISIN